MTNKDDAAGDEAQYILGPEDTVAVKKHVKRGGGAGWARVTVRTQKMKDDILQWGVAGQWPADIEKKGATAPYYSVHQIGGKACYIKSHEKKDKDDKDDDKKDKEEPDADKPKLFLRYENKGDSDIAEAEFKKYFHEIVTTMEGMVDWRDSNAVKNAEQRQGEWNPYSAMPNPYLTAQMYAQGFPWPAFGTWGYGGWEDPNRKGKGKGRGRGKGNKGEGKGRKDKKKKDKDDKESGDASGDAAGGVEEGAKADKAAEQPKEAEGKAEGGEKQE